MIQIQNKRNNYVDSQFVDVDDFQTEQSYFLDRLRSDNLALGGVGITNLEGLRVVPDTVMVEPILRSQVEVAIDPLPPASIAQGLPNPQNYSKFPGPLLGTSIILYTVFKTKTSNLQRVDLRVTLDQAQNLEELDLIVRIQKLIDPTNPLSPLANVPPIAEIQLEQEDLPQLDSDDFLELDFSNENSGQGVALIANTYYAVAIEFRRPVGSTSNIRVFHNPLDVTDQVDPDLLTWILASGEFEQGYLNEQNVLTQFQMYHSVYTSAVKVLAGEAHVDGKRVAVDEDQFRFLELPDRRNLDSNGNIVSNYVVLQYAEEYTDQELITSTGNRANSRIKDSASIQVLTQPQWETFSSRTAADTYLLLATVNDSNIVSIFKKNTFTVPVNSTNLAFHDWLNPNNVTPTEEAGELRVARPQDFIFFVSNVPGQVPLTDAFGNVQREPTTVRDELGNVVRRAGDPLVDDIVRVVVNISLDNGANTRTLELAVVSEVGSNREFRNYAATISSLTDNPFDNVFTFNLDVEQIAPNVIYNFVAFTKRGLPIYIQDYNRVISQVSTSGSLETIRNKTYEIFLDQDTLTAVINEDLQLGALDPASDSTQPGVVQYVSALIQGEIPTPVGSAQTEDIRNFIPGEGGDTKTLVAAQSFTFSPTPMIRWSQLPTVTKIPSTDAAITSAYDAGDITIKVDNGDGHGPIDITFSGLTDRDKGGNGAPVLITGQIDAAVPLSTTTSLYVKVRNDLVLFGARDNTNYSANYTPFGPAEVGGPGNIRSFTIIARGYDGMAAPLSNAGFNDGDEVFIWIDDQLALDINDNPISFVFDSNATTVTLPSVVYGLGSRKYFREKQILSIENTTSATPGTVLIDTGLDRDYVSKGFGQVIFSQSEIPTSINTSATIYIEYAGVEVIQEDISYFKTKFRPIGTRDGFKISNTNIVSSADEFISVPEAFALTAAVNEQALDPSTFQSVAIFVDGINITSLLSPIGQKSIVADDGATLQPGQVAFNPDEGTIKFHRESGTSEAPTDFTRITVAYFKLDTKFVFNTVTGASYDPRYDINNDGHIDEKDLNIFNRAYGTQIGDINYLAAADFNNDGNIDDSDLAAFREHFGSVALGQPDYSDATTARLGALFVAKADNYLKTARLIRAVSRAPDAIAPTGRTVLFFDENTPINEAGTYIVTFGFAAAMSLGFNQVQIDTARPLIGKFNLNNIQMFETVNPLNTRTITQVETNPLPNDSNRYDSLLTFTPAVSSTSEFTIKSLWSDEGIAVFNRADLIIPQKYEVLDRKVYGPFKLQYTEADFDSDGTSVAFTLKATDASLADGSPDPTGTHIGGVPISELTFTVHLTIPNDDGTSSIWTWHDIQPSGVDSRIKLSFSENLFIDHRIKGRNNAEVLTPFGLAKTQVALKPKYSGGDLENDLANISVIRSDVKSKYVQPHDHLSERSGGILTSKSVQFTDELARLEPGSLTDIIYKLLDIIEEQERQIDLIRAVEGVVRWDRGLFWDDPNLFWDVN